MNRKSQKNRVIAILKQDGQISRNQCLDFPFADKITRLSDIMFKIKRENLADFETEETEHDYIYRLKNWVRPPKIVGEIVEVNGERVYRRREVLPETQKLI
jgi:hypothetical protein